MGNSERLRRKKKKKKKITAPPMYIYICFIPDFFLHGQKKISKVYPFHGLHNILHFVCCAYNTEQYLSVT